MRTVVISQPMFFPWPGMLEQLSLADVFVHYDDVQFSKGSFTNRVQVKTARGIRWLTVPLPGLRLGQRIDEVSVDADGPWRAQHLALLGDAYAEAPYAEEMLRMVRDLYERPWRNIAELAMASFEAVSDYFGLSRRAERARSSDLDIGGRSDERVLSVVRHFGGQRYVTGHGAKNYLDHERFEAAGVDVLYMDYRKEPYPQLHGPFTPFVSVLDLVANRGKEGRQVISSPAIPWREFIARQSRGGES